MCSEYIDTCPIILTREVPSTQTNNWFFQSKVRHRGCTSNGTIINEAVGIPRFYERGLDLAQRGAHSSECAVILPDGFKLAHSSVELVTFVESVRSGADAATLGTLAYAHSAQTLSHRAQHIVASSVPFVYCINLSPVLWGSKYSTNLITT